VGLPVLRLVVDVAAVMTVGLLLTASFLLPSPGGELAGLALRAQRAAGAPAAVWALGALAQAFFTVSDLFAVPPGVLLRSTTWFTTVLQFPQGKSLIWQAGWRSWSPCWCAGACARVRRCGPCCSHCSR
jgi:putative copper resistance protein D